MLGLTIDHALSALHHRRIKATRTGGAQAVTLHDLPLARVRVLDTGGSGAAIVFLCDGPVVIEHYERVLSLSPPGLRHIVVEMPGFGFSYARRSYDFSLEHSAQVLISLFDKLQLRARCVVAPCVNTYTALKVCERRPELIEALCVLQAPCWAEEIRWARRIDNAHLGTSVIGQLIMAAFPKRVARHWFRNATAPATNHAPLGEIAVNALSDGACFCLASMAQQWFGPRVLVPQFSRVQVPALAIWGMDDKTHRSTKKQTIQELLPQAPVREVQQAGHFVELEQPVLLWRLMCESLPVG